MDTERASAELERRQQAEREFHDQKYGGDHSNSLPSHYVDNPTLTFYQALVDSLGPLGSLRVLDLGCGDGWITADLLSRDAQVVAIDISQEAVKVTTGVIEAANRDNGSYARVMGAELLDFPDQYFDLVLGFAILHHLDMPKALTEIHRVLKPGGRAAFAEPIMGNPMLRLYRYFTPAYRTPDEAPLDMRRFPSMVGQFSELSWRAHAFLSQGVIFLSGVRGMFKISRILKTPVQAVDRVIFFLVPPLRHWAWYVTLVVTK